MFPKGQGTIVSISLDIQDQTRSRGRYVTRGIEKGERGRNIEGDMVMHILAGGADMYSTGAGVLT